MAETELSLARNVARLLCDRGLTVAVAEGTTGGRIGERLVRRSGASAFFKGSVVTYDYPSRTTVLGIPRKLLATHGAVSEQVVRAMAQAVRAKFGADLGLASTGVAGPGGQQVGMVCIAVATKESTRSTRHDLPSGSRLQLHRCFTTLALRLLAEVASA
jgi:nicotinamide-nucleotide amidase